MNPNEILGAAEYEENVLTEFEPESMAFDVPDPDANEDSDHLRDRPSGATAPSAVFDGLVELDTAEAAAAFDPDDPSRLVPSHQDKFIDMSKFEMALATFIELDNVSRNGYDRLLEVLSLLTDRDGNVLPQIANLPSTLATLRDKFRKRLPLINMREADIPLDITKMPTIPPGLAPEERLKFEAYKAKQKAAEEQAKSRKGKRGKAKEVVADVPLPLLKQKLSYFDPISMLKNFVASDIFRDAHHGPALFVDEPVELFHSHAWASSVRSSEGIYPHIWVDGKPDPEATIFPSDFLYYRCMEHDCYCHQIEDDGPDTGNLHIGRVFGFGYEKREASPTYGHAGLTLQIQEALRPDHRALGKTKQPGPALEKDELVLNSDPVHVIESNVFAFLDVYVDKLYGETHDDPAEIRASKKDKREKKNKKAKPIFKKYNEPRNIPPRLSTQWYQVRHMLVNNQLIPMCHTHPIRAELEIQCFGRSIFEDRWDALKADEDGYLLRPLSMSDEEWEREKESYKWYPIACCPLLTFIDGVGIFRNSYRSLMGFYITLASLSARERTLPRNILALIFGPHGSDFGDVVKALKSMAHLDKGLILEVNGVATRICAWTMAYTADMPQQAENSGLKGPRGLKFCRLCYMPKGQQVLHSDTMLDLDICVHGRYHDQIVLMQDMMDQLTGEAKENFGIQWGVNNPHPPLRLISPAADLVLSRPIDPAHSEFNGLSNLMHVLLKDGILAPKAREEYALALRAFKFPPNTKRLMSPLRHLASYSLSEHGIWSFVAPTFLRHWLREEHLKPSFVMNVTLMYPNEDNAVNMVVRTSAAIAKSNSVTMSFELSKEDRKNMGDIVMNGRRRFNQLSLVAAASMPSSRVGTAATTRAATPADGGADGGADADAEATDNNPLGHMIITGTGALQFLNNTLRPNIHAGVHWPVYADEYALPVNVNVLTGEDLHR